MLKDMKERIDRIEALVVDLKKLGEGAPVIERNTRCLLSYIWALKFAISDVAEVTEK
ncbi:MAG: hypothetical protein AB1512_08260 [Thermodesulfobacteriota bacterium]